MQQQLLVSNLGGRTLSFNVSASGGSWLTLANPTGSATPGSPAAVSFTLSPQGLSPGTYQGEIDIATTDGQQKAAVPVTLAVNDQTQSIVLTQTGLAFQAISQSGAPPSQSFSILNSGLGSMNWTATAQTFGSGSGWLSVSPASGTVQAGATPSTASVSVNPQNLSAGTYYGEIVVAATSAGNTPQIVSVLLNVLPSNANPPPVLSSLGLLPIGAGGGSPADSTTATNLGSQSLSYTSTATTQDGGNWLVVSPATGTIGGGASAQVGVQVNTTGLTPGLYSGTVRLGFSDQTVQSLNVVSVVTGSAASGQVEKPRASGCTPTAIGLVIQAPGDGFSVTTSDPVPVSAKIADNCGQAVTSGATVLANFGNGDPKLNMVSDSSSWNGTWTPQTAGSNVQVTVSAFIVVGQNLLGAQEIVTGTVAAASSAAGANADFVANSASYLQPGQVSAGSWIAIFGDRLADSQQATNTAPFPPSLAGTQVLFGTKALPLLYVSATQVNALIPYSLTSSTNHPLQIVRDGTTSTPFNVTQADVLPAIYTADQTGTGQGAILIAGTGSLAAPVGAFPGSKPVAAGQYIAIFANGLGPVVNTPADGAAAPSAAPFATTLMTPAVTIGGIPAPVIEYSGLAPGLVGLYQVNVQVPTGVTSGSAIPVVITVGGSVSNSVTIAVQ